MEKKDYVIVVLLVVLGLALLWLSFYIENKQNTFDNFIIRGGDLNHNKDRQVLLVYQDMDMDALKSTIDKINAQSWEIKKNIDRFLEELYSIQIVYRFLIPDIEVYMLRLWVIYFADELEKIINSNTRILIMEIQANHNQAMIQISGLTCLDAQEFINPWEALNTDGFDRDALDDLASVAALSEVTGFMGGWMVADAAYAAAGMVVGSTIGPVGMVIGVTVGIAADWLVSRMIENTTWEYCENKIRQVLDRYLKHVLQGNGENGGGVIENIKNGVKRVHEQQILMLQSLSIPN